MINYPWLYDLLFPLAHVTQSPEWHPEGTVLEHSMQCAMHARRECDDQELWLTALLHDVGKGDPEAGVDDGHEAVGTLKLMAAKPPLPPRLLWLVLEHMRIIRYLEGEMNRYQRVRDLAHHKWFRELVWLYRWDHKARDPERHLADHFSVDWLKANLEP